MNSQGTGENVCIFYAFIYLYIFVYLYHVYGGLTSWSNLL